MLLARFGASPRAGPKFRPVHAFRCRALRGGNADTRISRMLSVKEVLESHREAGCRYGAGQISLTWSMLGKLAGRHGRRELPGTDRLLEPLVVNTRRVVPTMDGRHVAQTAHGVAKVQRGARWRGSDALWDALTARATSVACDFKPRHHANTAWAYAKVGRKSPALFDAIAVASAARVREFKPQELANTAWAYATAGHASPALFDAIAVASVARVREFKPQELANTAWAYATAGHASPALFGAIASASAARVGEFKPQELANTAWAYAASDVRTAVLFASPHFADRCAELVNEIPADHLRQLHQWQLWLELERAGEGWPMLRADVRERCRAAFVAEAPRPSLMQRQVAVALAELGPCVTEEVRTAEGYSIDVVVATPDGRKVGVEVDGPSHFVGASHTPTGATLLKRRQLRAAGWTLLSVPYFEWAELNVPGDAEAQRLRRREYLGSRALRNSETESVDDR